MDASHKHTKEQLGFGCLISGWKQIGSCQLSD
jgi:hypothetical protein